MSENLQLLKGVAAKPSAVAWFKGLFTRAHVAITDTGEKFTILHHGDRAEVIEGFQTPKPNFVVPLQSENIRRLSAAFADDVIDAQEQYRIVKFMLRPCLEASLDMPILRNKTLLNIVKVDTHWQEALLDPQGNEDEQLTIIYTNKQWLVIPGYHGKPQRRLRLTAEQLLDFQRRVFQADEANKVTTWAKLARWYVKWREEITVPV
jgi:hypothetical protein